MQKRRLEFYGYLYRMQTSETDILRASKKKLNKPADGQRKVDKLLENVDRVAGLQIRHPGLYQLLNMVSKD